MIKNIEMYTIICDNCGKDSNEDADHSGWDNKDFTEDSALEDGWKKEKNKHYCNDCWSYDEDENIVLKKFN